MPDNRALRLHAYGGPEGTHLDSIEVPAAGPGQVLVHVRAAGVNALDYKVRQGFVRDAFPLELPCTLGVELSGVVAEVGAGVVTHRPGDRVMAWLAGFGAYANYVAIDAAKLAHTPRGLDDVQAAAVSLAALAAWQLIHRASGLRAGQTILIHGASGAVGTLAVQFGKAVGAKVLAVASGDKVAPAVRRDADRLIDRRAERFEDVAKNVDVALDLVGGDVLERTWAVMAPGGLILSAVTPVVERAPDGLRGQFHITRIDTPRLKEIADRVAAGTFDLPVGEVVGFSDLAGAIDRNWSGRSAGKMVVAVNP
jgi:NADPH:quinone reductase-like Zn-dependent oxidoreductase